MIVPIALKRMKDSKKSEGNKNSLYSFITPPNRQVCFRQCKHTIPAVCMTRVGAGLNLILEENGQKKLFTVDLVPSYKVKVPQGFGELQLRQVRYKSF